MKQKLKALRNKLKEKLFKKKRVINRKENHKIRAKSIILGRKKPFIGNEYCFFVSLFDVHNPIQYTKAPNKVIEFEKINDVKINGLKVGYMLNGNDIVIDRLEAINIVRNGDTITISGKQKL